MVILGLTGSIGMGKTTAAEGFRSFGIPVHDADATVHELMASDGAATEDILDVFPEAKKREPDGTLIIDRQVLAEAVFGNDEALKKLEAILHPLVREKEKAFLEKSAAEGAKMVVLDIPLLLETGGDKRCDGVVVVTAPADVQEKRVLKRPGMTPERLRLILARQVPDAEKLRRADFIINTNQDRKKSLREIEKVVSVASKWDGKHWAERETQERNA